MKIFPATFIIAVVMFSAYAAELYDAADNHYNDPNSCVDVACADDAWKSIMSNLTVVESVKQCGTKAKTCIKELTENYAHAITDTSEYYKDTKEQSLCPQEKYRTLYMYLYIINYRRNLLIAGLKETDADLQACVMPWVEDSNRIHRELNACWKVTGAQECKEEKH